MIRLKYRLRGLKYLMKSIGTFINKMIKLLVDLLILIFIINRYISDTWFANIISFE